MKKPTTFQVCIRLDVELSGEFKEHLDLDTVEDDVDRIMFEPDAMHVLPHPLEVAKVLITVEPVLRIAIARNIVRRWNEENTRFLTTSEVEEALIEDSSIKFKPSEWREQDGYKTRCYRYSN